MTRPLKHSLTLNGHRTSVSLETEFWQAFCKMADENDQPINSLAAEIHAARDTDTGLATAIRLFVLRNLQAKVATLP